MTVEQLPRTDPLRGWPERFAALPDAVRITAEPFVAMASVRLDPGGPAAAAVADHLGVALPTAAATWVSGSLDGDPVRVIWLGPDEWLVTSSACAPDELEAGLRGAVAGAATVAGVAVVDVSAQHVTLRLRGEHARDVLATGCALDLHPRVFGAGRAARTTLGLAGVALLVLDPAGGDYQIIVRASFARYLADWLLDAASEFSTEFSTENSTTDPGRGA